MKLAVNTSWRTQRSEAAFWKASLPYHQECSFHLKYKKNITSPHCKVGFHERSHMYDVWCQLCTTTSAWCYGHVRVCSQMNFPHAKIIKGRRESLRCIQTCQSSLLVALFSGLQSALEECKVREGRLQNFSHRWERMLERILENAGRTKVQLTTRI